MVPLFVCLALTGTFAQTQTAPSYHTGVDLVSVNVTVFDRSQRLVGGLPQTSFELFDDGVSQDISYFESRDVPLDVVLLIDTSSSMYDKLRAIRLAAAAFAHALRPGDRGAVMTFNSHVTRGVPLTAQAEILDAAIRGISAGGGTSLYDSIYIALRGLISGTFLRTADDSGSANEGAGGGNGGGNGGGDGHQADRIRRQAIVVLTDGTDTTSLMAFDVLQAEARHSNVMIYGICIGGTPLAGSDAETQWQGRLDVNMRDLSRDTGGIAVVVKTESELAAAYDRVTSELMHQYLLAYSPKGRRSAPAPPSVPGFHRIVVRLRDVPDATVRARPGYMWTRHQF
jgi:VWFA-related protein